MEKPKDIPQDVWLKADVLASEYRGVRQVEMIARAILSAVEEENEACARMIETGEGWIGKHHRGDAPFSALIASAIRNRRNRKEA